MNPSRRLLLLCLIAASASASLVSLAANPKNKEIERLIKQLGRDDFQQREAAIRRLTKIGEPAWDALQQAKSSDDPEVRIRSKQIIAAIVPAIDDKNCVEQLRLMGHDPDPKIKRYPDSHVTRVSVSADGKRLLTSGFGPTAWLWDIETGKKLRVLEGSASRIVSAALSPDGTRALGACPDNSVRLWDVTTGEVLHQMDGHRDNGSGVRSVAFGASGQGLSGGTDGQMILWDLNTGEKARVFTCHRSNYMVEWVAYLEKARLAATSGDHQPTRLWDLETGKEVHSHITSTSDYGGYPASACFSPDGKHLALWHSDHKVRIFDVDTDTEVTQVDPPPASHYRSEACRIAFSPNGKCIASGCWDNTVRIWDVKSGKELRKYEGHTDGVTCVLFFANGQRIASASRDGTVRIWGAPRAAMLLDETEGK